MSRTGSFISGSVASEFSNEHERRIVLGKKLTRKLFRMVCILSVTILPILTLVIQNAIASREGAERMDLNKIISKSIRYGVELSSTVHQLQIQRGLSVLYIGSNLDNSVFVNLQKSRAQSDKYLAVLPPWLDDSHVIRKYESTEALSRHIKNFRYDIGNRTHAEIIEFYSSINDYLLESLVTNIKLADRSDLGFAVAAYHMFLLSKEQTGIERALGSIFFAKGEFGPEVYYNYTVRKLLGEQYLVTSQEYSKIIRDRLKSFGDTTLSRIINYQRQQILRNNVSDSSVIRGEIWFSNLTSYLNFQKQIQDELALELIHNLTNETQSLKLKQSTSITGLTLAVLVSPIFTFCTYRLLSKLENFNKLLQKRGDIERKERKRNQTLLYEMLPAPVARKLLTEQHVDPEHFKGCTVFFSEICDFADIVSASTPLQIIEMMNAIYGLYDSKLIDNDVYKVETVGDTYMVVSGVPNTNPKHAIEAANFSFDIMAAFKKFKPQHQAARNLSIKIGLNSGPVVTGVVGIKMPRYCLFGDTVNTASRMMSTGMGGKIHISESTKNSLHDRAEFVIQNRGEVYLKGKGVMSTFWLELSPEMHSLSPSIHTRIKNEESVTLSLV